MSGPAVLPADGASERRAAAQGLEAMLLRQMLSAMRAAGGSDPLTGSAAQDQFRELFDAQIAEQIAQGPGLGIAAAFLPPGGAQR